MTWSTVREGGYDLFFNRDELDTRGPELRPRVEKRDGVEFAAPRDGDRGGAWLLVNAHGVTVALLNDYAASRRPPSANSVSRGSLVLACAGVAAAGEAARLVGIMPLERTGAFKMVVLGPDGRGRRLRWDGASFEDGGSEGASFETSSSFDTAAVCAARRRRFEALLGGRRGAEARELEAFHWTRGEADGASAVLMSRPDARTRSVTRVCVRADRVAMHYRPVGGNGEPMVVAEARLEFPRT